MALNEFIYIYIYICSLDVHIRVYTYIHTCAHTYTPFFSWITNISGTCSLLYTVRMIFTGYLSLVKFSAALSLPHTFFSKTCK